MTVLYILALFNSKLCVVFKFGKQYFIDSNFILKSNHKRISIWINCTTKNGFLFLGFKACYKLTAHYILIFLNIPQSYISWSSKHTILSACRYGYVALMRGSATILDFIKSQIVVAGIKTNVLAFPKIYIVFRCTHNHILVIVTEKYFANTIALL